MKIIGVVFNAAILVLMVIGITFVGAFVGEELLGAHGGKFLDLTQQLVVASMLFAVSALLLVCTRFSLTELAVAAVLAQAVVVLIIAYTSGWHSFDWMWRLTRFTTLPFDVGLGIGYVITRFKATGSKASRPSGLDS